MRFSLAVGILVQTLPALSENAAVGNVGTTPEQRQMAEIIRSVQEKSNSQGNVHHFKKSRALRTQRRLELQPQALRNVQDILKTRVLCDPSSTDADTGILSCGEGRTCKALAGSELGGICIGTKSTETSTTRKALIGPNGRKSRWMNHEIKTSNVVECDPTSVDVGILACREGEFCRKEDSAELGGICVPSFASSRHLYTVDLCDPTSSQYYDSCDCSGLNITSGTGVIECRLVEDYDLGIAFPGCEGGTASISTVYSFEDSVPTTYQYCYEITLSDTDKLCITTDEIGSCTAEFDDQTCNSCRVTDNSYLVDCSNTEGGGMGDTPTDFMPILSECYKPSAGNNTITYNCTSLCADGEYIPYINYGINVTIPGIGDMSCAYLALAEAFAVIPDYACSPFAAAAQSGCCVYQCDLCGPTAYIAEQNFDTPVNIPVSGYEGYTCGDFAYGAYINFTIPKGMCTPIAGLMQQSCCEAMTRECNFCGGDLTYPDAILEGYNIPCATLESYLSSTECDVVAPLVSRTCCNTTASSTQGGETMQSTIPSQQSTPISTPAATAVQQEPQTGAIQSQSEVSSGSSPFLPVTKFASFLSLTTAAIVLITSSS